MITPEMRKKQKEVLTMLRSNGMPSLAEEVEWMQQRIDEQERLLREGEKYMRHVHGCKLMELRDCTCGAHEYRNKLKAALGCEPSRIT